jgi:K+-sensing histidine kinase KdpD
VIVITRISLQLGGTIANPTTVGFSFLIVVALSALFAGTTVGVATSIVATLFFNYYFFEPVGTFTIADRHNWIAVVTFLFTAVLISRLTTSALANARKANSLDLTIHRLKEFGEWLLSTPANELTLSDISKTAVRMFLLDYCSIHVYAEGKWHHFTGASFGRLNEQVAESLKTPIDHPTGILELAEEEGLGVRYASIRSADKTIGLLVLRDGYLTREAIQTIASMIGIVLLQAFEGSQHSTRKG